MALRNLSTPAIIRVMTSHGFRVHVTRAQFERGQRCAALAGLLTVLLPLAVIFFSSALASARRSN